MVVGVDEDLQCSVFWRWSRLIWLFEVGDIDAELDKEQRLG